MNANVAITPRPHAFGPPGRMRRDPDRPQRAPAPGRLGTANGAARG
ncbi:MAG: hypothetical protein ABSH33_03735 [Steroidobacteraceae bacterium]